MSKFYGDDINKIDIKYLLEATPFNKDSRFNFLGKLTPDYFFSNLYCAKSKNSDASDRFDEHIDYVMGEVNNPFAKVALIHISGYGGCGKTTFIHHLLWSLAKKEDTFESVLDFEGEKRIVDAYIDRLSDKIFFDMQHNSEILSALKDISRFHLRFFGNSISRIESVIKKICTLHELSEDAIRTCFTEQNKQLAYNNCTMYLVVFDFLWALVKHIRSGQGNLIFIVFDNVDSISDLDEEQQFVSALKNFINQCNYFLGMNLSNENLFLGKQIKDIMTNLKIVCFLTTRIITINRFLELEPDLERVYGWSSIEMPENYYNHAEVIAHRTKHYMVLENNNNLTAINSLSRIQEVSDLFYKTGFFKRIFNGNIRFCLDCICSIIHDSKNYELLKECKQLYSKSNDASEGAVGIMLSLILQYLKSNNLYENKLHLQGCSSGQTVSISRLILTILREKGGTCSFLDLLMHLSAFFSVEEICNVVYDLSEAGREVWRRLLVFDSNCPASTTDFEQQGLLYLKGITDVEQYSEISICLSGVTYIESIVPRFEFILSRRKKENRAIWWYDYQPLFTTNSEDIINAKASPGAKKYRFERKIDSVFYDVCQHCKKSVQFAEQVMDSINFSRSAYVQDSFYNFHPINTDGSYSHKQSYESRLIFSHIGYIERYRRYLLQKRKNDDPEILQDINRRIIQRLKQYIKLYFNRKLCFGTFRQDQVATFLDKQINIIEQHEYCDFQTRIEIVEGAGKVV